MRIAYDHQIFSWQKYGGISRYIFEIANNLANRAFTEVSIVSPIYVNEYISDASSALRIIGHKVPHLRRTGSLITNFNRVLSPQILSQINPDIVHETYYMNKRLAPSRALVVLTVHDMIHEKFPYLFPAGDKTAALKSIAAARADHIICISESTKRDLIDILNVNPAKISVVYHGYTLRQSSPALPLNPERPYLLYVGHREGYKNFNSLLLAYADNLQLMASYDLMAFGGGVWTNEELKQAKALGINLSRLRNMQGNDATLASLYSRASLLVFPSLYEGFGIPPLEAMSFGCPVVCSNASSLPEVVGDAAEMFDPLSPTALQAAIERILNDSTHRSTLIQRGHSRTSLFSWRRSAEETLSVYKKLVRGR